MRIKGVLIILVNSLVMKGEFNLYCKVCETILENPSYRQIFPYFNFPAHRMEDWGSCKQGLLEQNMTPAYQFLKQAVNLSTKANDFPDIKNLLNDSNSNFELLLQIDRLGELINSAFPEVEIIDTENFVPAEVQLDSFTYQKLVAYELETNTRDPIFLRNTTKEIFESVQKGEMNLNSPFYYGTIPAGRSSQSVRVPEELIRTLRYPFIHRERALERILMEYAEHLNVSPRNEDIAYLILKRDIRPSNIRRRVRGERASYTVNYINMDHLPGDKRSAISKALQSVDTSFIRQVTVGMDNKPLTSVRVDYSDKKEIDKLSRELHVPVYKVTTALLLYSNYVKA